MTLAQLRQGHCANEICPFGQVKSLRGEIFALQIQEKRTENPQKFSVLFPFVDGIFKEP